MRKFKYYLAFFTLCALLMTGCSKDEPTGVDINDPSSEKLATLTIGASLNDILNLNRAHLIDDLPACSDDTPVLASIVLRPGDKDNTSNANDIILDIEIVAEDYNNDNVIDYFTVYEEALKLPAGTYTLRQFFVYSDEDKDMEDLIWIAPFDDGDGEGTLSEFVENPLPLEFNLFDGEKRYVDVEVLCYDQRDVNEYGFVFFDILPRKIYNFCFFANYCVGNRDYPANYSLELWYGTNIENPESNTPLVGPETNMVGYYNNDGEEVDGPTDRPFARPLCIPIPEPGPNDTGAYLTYRLTLEDWDGVYGSAAGTDPIVGTLSWAQILGFLDTDEDGEITDADTANIEYLHLFFDCEDRPGGGDPTCPDGADPDNDNIGLPCDNCPGDANTDQLNSDNDSLGDACDNCPFVDNEDQKDDDDGDDVGDACDQCPDNVGSAGSFGCPDDDCIGRDFDGDGLIGDCDPCPYIFGDECDDGEKGCETAWMYGDHTWTKKDDDDLKISARWGWAEEFGVGSDNFEGGSVGEFPFFAGAGQNDYDNNGYLAGKVTVSSSGSTITVTVEAESDVNLNTLHIYTSDMMPTTAAPGQFDKLNDVDGLTDENPDSDNPNIYQFTYSGDGDFWIAVHGDVCGEDDDD
ncbi:hypothetical protein [Gramella sp. MAR_2010_147]|uniref:hypothetical protein n=1 Tax=Gramella sp. MAR_2010_147 TaxID=1250205 RepID=UPI00087C33F7|nr:hypothetical protein [Gramella sp. MAR_2010_147]SDR68810.1 hypothetical protein SAMN04488553_0290 [Gramella sp. MAR_2010_147]